MRVAIVGSHGTGKSTLLKEQQYQESRKQNESFISDRGVYDNLAYAKNVSVPLYDMLVDRTKRYHKGYDHVFYTPNDR